ncbi:hypothetical protein [Bdellovibrio sp. HCB2-146]|uniref:hypothetical protein n=1 Tax=Bdellovibrio sp. HCB2-146 TaxID=3394362 RepID=UPI0039BD87F1
MKKFGAFVSMMIFVSSSAFASSNFNLVMTCNGLNKTTGQKLIVQVYQNLAKGKDLVTVGQQGDSNQQPYEASVLAQEGLISFDLEFVRNGLQLGANIVFGNQSVVSGVALESNNSDIARAVWTCSNDQ